jgi:hypothetical protein
VEATPGIEPGYRALQALASATRPRRRISCGMADGAATRTPHDSGAGPIGSEGEAPDQLLVALEHLLGPRDELLVGARRSISDSSDCTINALTLIPWTRATVSATTASPSGIRTVVCRNTMMSR